MKYRKRPEMVDAVQWRGDNRTEVYEFLRDIKHHRNPADNTITISTVRGPETILPGQWIICAKGDVYGCESKIFELYYECAGEPANAR